jgi:aspartate ammonia-lyase
VHTARAIENFPITGHTVAQMPELIRALAPVKKAAAHANLQFGANNASQAGAIAKACDDLIAGKLPEEFVVDVIQGGAGTSTNMNANEVIAKLTLEHLGLAKGRYDIINPNDHVNASQSTSDVYPIALKLATWFGIQELLKALASLRGAFDAKAHEFHGVLKIGRTQLQDAVLMTLGQEFTALPPPPTPAPLWTSPAFSSALPASCPRSATTGACFPPARRRVWAISAYPRARPALRSCRASSIR